MLSDITSSVHDRFAPIARRRPLAGLKITAEDDPRQRKTYPLLRQSLAASGINNVPIFHSPDDDVVDGNTRVCALIDLGMTECLAIELPRDWDEAKILCFSIATDGVRRTLPPEELAGKAERYMVLTDSTQEAAARQFGISPAHLSRALASLLMPERHRAATSMLQPSIRTLIAAETEGPVQDGLVEFATKVGSNGKLPTRDAVELHRKQLRGGKQKGRPKTHLEAKTASGNVVESFRFRADATPAQLALQLRSVADLVDKHSADGMKAILALIEARKPGKGSATPPTT